ncbi:hypothetical protein BH11MYX1_BH11MYX1_33420 [soil metagenome]
MGWALRGMLAATVTGLVSIASAGGSLVNGARPSNYVHFTFDDGADGSTWKVAQLLANARIPDTFFVAVDKVRKLTKDEADTLFAAISSDPEHVGLFLSEPPARARRSAEAELEDLVALGSRAITLYRRDPSVSNESRRALARRGITEVTWSIATADLATSDPGAWSTEVVERIARHNGGVVRVRSTTMNQPALIAALVTALGAENCKRWRAGTPMILAAPIDFFVREAGKARAVTDHAKATVAAYRDAVERSCEVQLTDHPEQVRKPFKIPQECLDNPLARGCS